MAQSTLRKELERERTVIQQVLDIKKRNESEERRLKWGRKKNATSTFKVMLKP